MNGLRTRTLSESTPRDDERDGVGRPSTSWQAVRPLLGVAEDRHVVDDEEADGHVVEQQEHADGEGRADDVQPQHLPPVALSASSGSSPAARASMSARSRRLTISWSRSCGDSSRRPTKAMTNTTRPAMPQTWNWNASSEWLFSVWLDTTRDDEAAENRAEGPEAHGNASPDLRREVADQCRGGHEDDALDEADDGEQEHVDALAAGVREPEQDQQPGDQQAVRRRGSRAPSGRRGRPAATRRHRRRSRPRGRRRSR